MDDLAAEPLLYIPVGSFTATSGDYSLKVQLAHRYRIVLLNASGRSFSTGRITAKWGNEILMDESTQQGNLLVYAIERTFTIIGTEDGTSTQSSPTSKPTNGNLFGSPDSSIDETSPDSDNLFKVEEPFLSFGVGFYTIDPVYVSNLGYTNSTISVEVFVTSDSFTQVTDGVTIAPVVKGNAMSLNGSAYVLANGGVFIGSSVGNGEEAGHGISLDGTSKIDILEGVIVKGGSAEDHVQSAALHASGEAAVTIRGGEFHGEVDSNTPSLEVFDYAAVTIYGGLFVGAWNVRNGGSIIVHACSFVLGSDSVKAKLLDSTFLDVPFTSDGQSKITPEFHTQSECIGILATKQPTTTPSKPSQRPSTMPMLSPTLKPTITPSHRPSISPTKFMLMESSLPPADSSSTNSPTMKFWSASDFAPDEFPESELGDRPAPVQTLVPEECLAENTAAVSFIEQEMIILCCPVFLVQLSPLVCYLINKGVL
jgi:hypothetical protein